MTPTSQPGYDNDKTTLPISPYGVPWEGQICTNPAPPQPLLYSDIPSTAKFIWYESGKIPSGGLSWKIQSPFYAAGVSGGHDEFLIFRVAGNIPAHTNDWLNKTLKNTSPTAAYDFALILKGNVLPLSWHQDGFIWPWPGPLQGFNSFSATLSGGNTLLRWWNFVDGVNTQIDIGQEIHIGWGVFWPLKAEVVNAYWTDANGNPIQGSYIKQVNAYGMTNGIYWQWAVWHNTLAPLGIPDTAVTLRDVQFAVFDTLVPPDSLNSSNVALESAFQPMSSDTAIRLPYCQSVSLTFPTPILKTQWVVLKYKIEGPGSAAEVTDYVELAPQATQTGAIPTLTEWGLIIFAVLLVGFMTWVVVRRRRRVTIGI